MRYRSSLLITHSSMARSGAPPEGDRPIIGEAYLHMGTKAPRGHPGVPCLCAVHEIIEQALTLSGWCGRREARPHALLSIRPQGELWHEQEPPLDVCDT